MKPQAAAQDRYKKKHPERAAMLAARNVARHQAMRNVALRHPTELDREYRAECRRRGIPWNLPKLPADQDGRRAESR